MSEFKLNCPHCEQTLEVPEEMLGETIECPSCKGSIELPKAEQEPTSQPAPEPAPPPKRETTDCPYCGEEILRSAQKCKHCGEFIKGHRPVETNVKQGALIGAIVCLVVGIILMFVSLWSFIIYSPLFLAAFILSIVAMAQKRVAGGLVTLLLTLIIPPVLFVTLGAVRGKDAMDKASRAMNQASTQIERETKNIHEQTILNNLKIIEGAKAMWALENNKVDGTPVTKSDILNHLPSSDFPSSPSGARYNIQPIGEDPACRYDGKLYTPNDWTVYSNPDAIIQVCLATISSAKEKWAMKNRKPEGSVPSRTDIATHIPRGFPSVPKGAKYNIRAIGKTPKCIFNGKTYSIAQ